MLSAIVEVPPDLNERGVCKCLLRERLYATRQDYHWFLIDITVYSSYGLLCEVQDAVVLTYNIQNSV